MADDCIVHLLELDLHGFEPSVRKKRSESWAFGDGSLGEGFDEIPAWYVSSAYDRPRLIGLPPPYHSLW